MIRCLKIVGLVLISVLALSACKTIKIQNGRIPAEYLQKAQEVMGDYSGEFEGRKGTLHLELQGDYLKLSFINGSDNDILGASCQSVIGDLTHIYVSGSEDNPVLDGASFSFNPNQCQILGRELSIDINHDDGKIYFRTSIMERQDVVTECTGPYPQGCHTVVRPVFLRGDFSR